MAQNLPTLDNNGVRIHDASGVETKKERSSSVSPTVLTVDQMDLVQSMEFLSVLQSKVLNATGSEAIRYQQQIVMLVNRIKFLVTNKD